MASGSPNCHKKGCAALYDKRKCDDSFALSYKPVSHYEGILKTDWLNDR